MDLICLCQFRDSLIRSLAALPSQSILLETLSESDSDLNFVLIELTESVQKDANELQGLWKLLENYYDLRMTMIFNMINLRSIRKVVIFLESILKIDQNTILKYVQHEMENIAQKYLNLLITYVAINQKLQNLDIYLKLLIKNIIERIYQLFKSQVEQFFKRCHLIRKSCLREMSKYIPTSFEKRDRNQKFEWKKQQIYAYKSRYQNQIINELNDFCDEMFDGILVIVGDVIDDFQITSPDREPMISSLKNVIYKIWKAFYDFWFLEKGWHTFEENIEQSEQDFKEACTQLNGWVAELNHNIVRMFHDKISKIDIYKEIKYYQNYSESLKEFYQNFIEIDFIKNKFSILIKEDYYLQAE